LFHLVSGLPEQLLVAGSFQVAAAVTTNRLGSFFSSFHPYQVVLIARWFDNIHNSGD